MFEPRRGIQELLEIVALFWFVFSKSEIRNNWREPRIHSRKLGALFVFL